MNLPAAKFTLSPKVTEGLFLGRILLFTIPPSRLREPPPVHYRPIIHLKGVTHYTLQARRVKKDRESTFSVLAVGANCVRPRAFTERPYEDDFLSVGITCFMGGTACGVLFVCYGGTRSSVQSGYCVKAFHSAPKRFAACASAQVRVLNPSCHVGAVSLKQNCTKKPPLCKGRWMPKADGGVVKT